MEYVRQDGIANKRKARRIVDVLVALRAIGGEVDKPRASSSIRQKSARAFARRPAITAAARRAVAARSQCRCEYVGANGKRCDETAFLEIDHVVPVARGGTSDPSNLRHLCRAHNRLAAEELLGKGYVQQAIDHARRKPPIRDVAEPARLYRRRMWTVPLSTC